MLTAVTVRSYTQHTVLFGGGCVSAPVGSGGWTNIAEDVCVVCCMLYVICCVLCAVSTNNCTTTENTVYVKFNLERWNTPRFWMGRLRSRFVGQRRDGVRVRRLELSSMSSQFSDPIITSQSYSGPSFLFRKRFRASFCMLWERNWLYRVVYDWHNRRLTVIEVSHKRKLSGQGKI